ncbi:MAG: hypothetical protein ACP5HU_11075 [Phycisphaerae bacterium]
MAFRRRYVFRRHGKSVHLRIRSAEDLQLAADLDEALWVATNAPTATLSADPVLLAGLDLDGNGRITCAELKIAIRRLLETLTDHSGIDAAGESLKLDALNTETADGRRAGQSARKVLRAEGNPDGDTVALEQVRRVMAEVERSPVSEAGVVLPTAADDHEVREFLTDIISTVGGAPHPRGVGVSADKLDEFLSAADGYLRWRQEGELTGGATSDVMPLGKDTPAAFELFQELRDKLDQYFAQCRAVALDARLAERIGRPDAIPTDETFEDPAAIEELLRKAPLARPRADGVLPLGDELNPYYAESVRRFARDVASRVLQVETNRLREPDWRRLRQFFADYENWLSRKAGAAVEPLGPGKLQKYLDEQYASAARELIAESRLTAFDLDGLRTLERIILHQANLLTLANNMVSFPHLYDPNSHALFELGSLVMDSRRFTLAVRADDRNAHAAVAQTSNMYVMYVEVSPAGETPYTVALPVTSGGRGNLCVGKRGIFIDSRGRECDARVVHIIENPVSIAEALWAPFRRLGRLLTGKIESLTTQAEQKLDASATAAMSQVTPGGQQPAQTRPPTSTGGLLLGGGVAVAALGSAVAYITKTLAGLTWLKVLMGVLVAVGLVLVPTSIVAILKLRRRDLSAILEGSGWGVNARMRLTRRQSRTFTRRPPYPAGSRGTRRWLRAVAWIAVLVAVLSLAGWLLRYAF